jgi:hypothetical protein
VSFAGDQDQGTSVYCQDCECPYEGCHYPTCRKLANSWLQGKVDDVLEKAAEKILCNGHKIGCVCGACVETKRASEIVRAMKSKGA